MKSDTSFLLGIMVGAIITSTILFALFSFRRLGYEDAVNDIANAHQVDAARTIRVLETIADAKEARKQ